MNRRNPIGLGEKSEVFFFFEKKSEITQVG